MIRLALLVAIAGLQLLAAPIAAAESPPRPGRFFLATLYIARPAAVVWAAITRKAEVDRYYLAPLGADIVARGQIIFYGLEDQRVIEGLVVDFVPERKLEHTFRFTHMPPGTESRVTYELEPMGEMSALHVFHDGFGADRQSYRDVNGGWPIVLSNLKTILETGKPLPWPEQQ